VEFKGCLFCEESPKVLKKIPKVLKKMICGRKKEPSQLNLIRSL